jgi:hypothetical protein
VFPESSVAWAWRVDSLRPFIAISVLPVNTPVLFQYAQDTFRSHSHFCTPYRVFLVGNVGLDGHLKSVAFSASTLNQDEFV